MTRLAQLDYTLPQAVQAVRTELTEGHQVALLPALEAATDTWRITLRVDGRGTALLRMQLDALSAVLVMRVTRSGRLTSLATSLRAHGVHHALSADPRDCTWPEPVPSILEWPMAAAEWVRNRTAEVPGDVAIQWQIKRLAVDYQSERAKADAARATASDADALADKIATQIRELKAKLAEPAAAEVVES